MTALIVATGLLVVVAGLLVGSKPLGLSKVLSVLVSPDGKIELNPCLDTALAPEPFGPCGRRGVGGVGLSVAGANAQPSGWSGYYRRRIGRRSTHRILLCISTVDFVGLSSICRVGWRSDCCSR